MCFYICVKTFRQILWKSDEKWLIFYWFIIKMSNFEVFDPHYDVIKCPFSAKNFKISFYVCVQTFCQILWKSNEKWPIFKRFFIKYQIFRCLTPPLWRHKGVNFRQKCEFVKFTYFPAIFEKKSKIEAIFLKKVHFRDFDPPIMTS